MGTLQFCIQIFLGIHRNPNQRESFNSCEGFLKFIYSEKDPKFCKIFALLLTTVHTVKSKVKISQNFVAFSEYMNFRKPCTNSIIGQGLTLNSVVVCVLSQVFYFCSWKHTIDFFFSSLIKESF